ncbi:MAG: DUF1631 family protein [Pseudomonadota bacterium]
MRASCSSTPVRGLARSIRELAGDFLADRITNTLESTVDELMAQQSLEEIQGHEAPEADATRTDDLRILKGLVRTAGRDFCNELGEALERELPLASSPGRDDAEPGNRHRGLEASDGFEVALISDEELELSVMVSTVASRFERRNRETFESAVQLVGDAHGTACAEKLRSLVGVFPLINRFSRLLGTTSLSVATRAKLTNGFEFHVLEELGRFYQPLAKSLESAAAGAHDTASPAPEPARPASTSEWARLLHGGHAQAGPQQASGTRTGHAGHGSGDVGLNTYLADLAPAAAAGESAAGPAPAVSLYQQVLDGIGEGAATRVPPMDLDVLHLVSLFFETFLNDDSLSTTLRFLVGRLQMPVLRVALADGAFFADDDHPARRLIQTLCQAGVGWSSDPNRVEHSPAFKEVNALVEEVLHHPAPDAALLEEVADRMQAIHAARQDKASRAEGRVVELEVGRAKLKAARMVVQDALNACLERHRAASLLRGFFADSWSKVLTFVCLRHGCEGSHWEEALGLADELADLFAPAATREEARSRTARIPHLLDRLEAHMVEAGLTSSHIDESIEALYTEMERVRESDDDWFASEGSMIVEQSPLPEPITLIPEPVPKPTAGAGGADLDAIRPGTWVRVCHDDGLYDQVKVAARVTETQEVLLVDERGARWGLWHEADFAAALEDGSVVRVDHDNVVQDTLDAMIAQLTEATPPQSALG